MNKLPKGELVRLFITLFVFTAIPLTILQVLRVQELRRAQAISNLTTLEGEFNILHFDNFDKKRSKQDFYLFLKDGRRILLIFADQGPIKVPPRSQVKVTGVLSGSEMNVSSSGGSDFQVISTAGSTSVSTAGTGSCQCDLGAVTQNNCVAPYVPKCTGKYSCACSTSKKIGVVLFNFQNDTSQPWTKEEIRTRTFAPSGDSVHSYYKEITFGKWNLIGHLRSDGDVFGWYTIPQTNTDCNNLLSWVQAAKSAATTNGVDLSVYEKVIFTFSFVSSCDFAGAAYLGGSEAFINFFHSTSVVGHELGHTYNLNHAATLTCTDTNGKRVSISNQCSVIDEYGDPFDTMGRFNSRHTSNYHKGKLNAYDYETQSVVTVTKDGTYTLAPIEIPTDQVQALRILRPDHPQLGDRYYWLEYRQPYGFDNFSLTDPVVKGVTVRLNAPDYGALWWTWLLDMTPETTSFNDSALAVGKTFFDIDKRLKIKVLSVNSTSATVEIDLNIDKAVVLNSATNLSCNQICSGLNTNCASVGTNSTGTNWAVMHFSDLFCSEFDSDCPSVMKDTSGTCSGKKADWTYCNCLLLTPTPTIIQTPTLTPTPRPTIPGDTPTPTPIPIPGGIAHKQTVTGGSTSSVKVSTSTSISAISNNLYLASIVTKPNVSVSSISGLGLTWTRVKAQCSGRAAQRVEVWKGIGQPSVSSGIVTATLSSTPKNAVIAVSRYSGVNTTSPIGVVRSKNTLGVNGACSGGTDSSSYSVSLTPTTSKSVFFGAVADRNRTNTPGSGYTERVEVKQGSSGDIAGLAIEDRLLTTTATTPVNGTLSGSTDWAVVGLEIR
ncbi:hypothetical protein HY008_02920 [Candidatus Woesebacteria bacterium]|nr:hypothetical protein [Candidatus Woesebacteria bacterium]